jgi:hypothetical protein
MFKLVQRILGFALFLGVIWALQQAFDAVAPQDK